MAAAGAWRSPLQLLTGQLQTALRGASTSAAQPSGQLWQLAHCSLHTSTACNSSSSSYSYPDNSQEDHFIGAYTPVTKKLWEERLAWSGKVPQQQQQQSPQVSSGVIKPPEVSSVAYSFTTNRTLAELYKNPWGYVRIGRILEDLDSMAGSIAFAHCRCPTTGAYPVLVTAAVDAITLRHPLQIQRDMVMRGQVVWTGHTALDIRLELLQEPAAPDPSLVALFSFVALDWATKRPIAVPQLLPQTPQEQQWSQERAEVAAQRKAARQAAAAAAAATQQGAHALTPELQQKLAGLEASSRLLQDMPSLADPQLLLMEQTRLANTFTCQPQQRNMHGRIFGGFLMRRAFELAFATTHMFAGCRPTILEVDEITFRKPVDVGDLLRFQSHVLEAEPLSPTDGAAATQAWRVVADVEAVVSRPEQRTSWPTNTFRFVFKVVLPAGQQLRRVLPGCAADVARLQQYWTS